MKKMSEILEDLLKTSHQIVEFIDEHAYGHDLLASNLRERYATPHFYISLDWHIAVVQLTAKQLRGPALTLIRPMCETWIKGTWIRFVASDEQIEEVTKSSKLWISPSMRTWDLINAVNEKEKLIGEVMKCIWASLDQYLNDCVHGNNQYINLFFNEQTQTLESNVPEEKMAVMLHVSNTVAMWSALQMKELHIQDPRLLSPFTKKLKEYEEYSGNLLQPIAHSLS